MYIANKVSFLINKVAYHTYDLLCVNSVEESTDSIRR